MNELKPCPFCGADAELRGGKGVASWIICNNKKCRATQGLELTGENAVKMWNTRPAEDAKDKEIERLKETIKEIRNIADKGLDMGIDFIGAGLDGMTGGVEDWQGMKRAKRKIRKLAKQALKKTTNAPDTGKMEEN